MAATAADLEQLALRIEVEDLYTAYAECLDEGRLEEWPALFTEECLYKVTSRENYDHGLPLGVMHCVSRGMLEDRVFAIRKTNMFAPRYLRHLVSGIHILGTSGGEVAVEANYAVLQTLVDDETKVFNAGRYLDRLVRDGGALRFRQRLCVYDSVVIPNSLIYPV